MYVFRWYIEHNVHNKFTILEVSTRYGPVEPYYNLHHQWWNLSSSMKPLRIGYPIPLAAERLLYAHWIFQNGAVLTMLSWGISE